MASSTDSAAPPKRRPPILEWLVRVNAEVSGWAAGASWWRLLFLFIVLLIAGSIISEQFDLRHERVRVPARHGGDKDVVVSIGGKDGIRISRPRAQDKQPSVPPVPPVPGAKDQGSDKPAIEIDEDDEDLAKLFDTQRVLTIRGVIGDLGAAILTILFAYLAASKVIVRKVAIADEKVRSAVSAAEREAMERQMVQARLQVLQAQVEPHFLFNTLSAVDYLIETDPVRASQMQKKLITYLRGALPQMRQESSTLGREIKLISSYLDLIKMRIEERLEVEIAVPDALEAAEFPPMMLQSLVENAIQHGIEPKPEGGKVSVSAKVQGGQLWVEVRDTGVGLVDPELLDSPTSGSGIGLQNIRERLAMLYPGKGRLTLMSDDRIGTVVRIGVPFSVNASAMPDGARPAESAA